MLCIPNDRIEGLEMVDCKGFGRRKLEKIDANPFGINQNGNYLYRCNMSPPI